MSGHTMWLITGEGSRQELGPAKVLRSASLPTPAPTMLLGSSVGPPSTWAAWNSECTNDGSKPGAANNGMAVHRTYSSGNIVSDFMVTAAAADVANGVASMWSCKPNLDTVASGGLDATFVSFFNSIPAGHRAYLMMWHEPWDDQFNWTTYRNAQARVWNLLHNDSTADTNRVKWGILGTSWDFIQGSAQANFFPSGSQFDFVGVDTYDMYRNLQVMPASPRGRNGHQSPAQRMGPVVAYANSVGRPWIVGEFGMHPDPTNPNGPSNWEGVASRPHRLASYLDYMIANGCEAAAWFHSQNGDDGPWWLNCYHNFTVRTDMSTPDTDTMKIWRDYLATYGKQ